MLLLDNNNKKRLEEISYFLLNDFMTILYFQGALNVSERSANDREAASRQDTFPNSLIYNVQCIVCTVLCPG